LGNANSTLPATVDGIMQWRRMPMSLRRQACVQVMARGHCNSNVPVAFNESEQQAPFVNFARTPYEIY
jgi:hypothetical protein